MLSEIEERLLNAHLDRCGPCAAFASDIDGMTRSLRSHELERPGLPVFRAPRRRQPRFSYVTASAAALAAVVVGGTVIGEVARTDRPESTRPPLLVDNRAVQNDSVLVRELRDFAIGRLASEESRTGSGRPGLLEG